MGVYPRCASQERTQTLSPLRVARGALAIAVFGALLAHPLAAAAASRLLQPPRGSHEPEIAPA